MKRCPVLLSECSKLLCGMLLLGVFASGAARAQDAASLQARYSALREPLANNAFRRPLVLESSQTASDLAGDIYAVLEQPYGIAGLALQGVDRWCDILILHLNVKACRAAKSPAGGTLSLSVGRKTEQPTADAYPVEFAFKVAASQADYLRVTLDADEGPLGTHDYRMVLEAVALDARRTFLHLSYSYAYGFVARTATQGYLATTGRDKVGFSIIGRKPDGQPVYMTGMRGVIERNTMRYYLAIEAYLGALSLPPSEQLEKRLNDWHAGVERYPLQLHELEREDYLAMKRREIRRQQGAKAG